MPNSQIVGVTHFRFIQWHVHVKAFANSTSCIMKIAFTKVGPKTSVLITMNREIQNSEYSKDTT